MRRWATAHLPSVALSEGLLILWQLAATSFGTREYILPSPAVVARALVSSEISWLAHTWTTSVEIVGAFVLAGVPGVGLTGDRRPSPRHAPGGAEDRLHNAGGGAVMRMRVRFMATSSRAALPRRAAERTVTPLIADAGDTA